MVNLRHNGMLRFGVKGEVVLYNYTEWSMLVLRFSYIRLTNCMLSCIE